MANLAPTWTLGDRLAKAREFGDVTVEQVMAEAGISRRTVTNYENDVTPPKRAVLLVYARLCGVSIEWLETGTIELSDQDEEVSSWDAEDESEDLDRLALAS